MHKLALSIFAVSFTMACHPVQADPRPGECAGILHSDRNGMRLGGDKGEDEGICIVRKSDERKVRAACSVGHFCRVKGVVEACKDSGECAEVTGITMVKKK